MRVLYRVFLLTGLALGFCGTLWADHAPGLFNTTGSGPINFLSAGTLDRHCWKFASQIEYVSFDRRSNEQLIDLTAQGHDVENVDYSTLTFVSVAFGLTEDITVVGRMPYAYQEDVREPMVQSGGVTLEDQGDAGGFGDFMLLFITSLWESDNGDIQISAISGLEMPTGRTNTDTIQDHRFALEHQPGSHSWDPLAGAAISFCQDRWSFHANATYLYTTESHQGTDLGDVVNYNLAAVYRIAEDEFSPGYHPYCQGCEGPCHGCCCHRGRSLDLIVELNGTWQDEHTLNGIVDHDSGGHVLWFSPGLRYWDHAPWCIYSSCSIPVAQDQNGTNREVELRIVLGGIFNW